MAPDPQRPDDKAKQLPADGKPARSLLLPSDLQAAITKAQTVEEAWLLLEDAKAVARSGSLQERLAKKQGLEVVEVHYQFVEGVLWAERRIGQLLPPESKGGRGKKADMILRAFSGKPYHADTVSDRVPPFLQRLLQNRANRMRFRRLAKIPLAAWCRQLAEWREAGRLPTRAGLLDLAPNKRSRRRKRRPRPVPIKSPEALAILDRMVDRWEARDRVGALELCVLEYGRRLRLHLEEADRRNFEAEYRRCFAQPSEVDDLIEVLYKPADALSPEERLYVVGRQAFEIVNLMAENSRASRETRDVAHEMAKHLEEAMCEAERRLRFKRGEFIDRYGSP